MLKTGTTYIGCDTKKTIKYLAEEKIQKIPEKHWAIFIPVSPHDYTIFYSSGF